MHPNPTRGFVWLVLAVCAGGLGLLLFGAEYLWVESAEGRVAEVVWSEGSGKRMCSPVFEYEVDGQLHRVERDVRESACGWSEGEALTIYYRANAPGKGYALTFFGLLPAILGAVISVLLLRASYRAFRGRAFTLEQQLSTVPIGKLTDAPQGEIVGIRGTLDFQKELQTEPLDSPMTGRRCIAWQLRVARCVRNERVVLRNDYALKQFELNDGDHEALANEGESVKVLLAKDATGRTKDEPSPKLEAFLRGKGVSDKDADTARLDLEWHEGVVAAGTQAVVYAVVETREGGYRLCAPPQGAIVVATEDLSKYKPGS